MKFSFFAVVAATLTLGIAAPASAANLLMCKASNAGASRGWISDKIVIAYEEGKKNVQVFDRVISNYGFESAVGKVETDNAKRTFCLGSKGYGIQAPTRHNAIPIDVSKEEPRSAVDSKPFRISRRRDWQRYLYANGELKRAPILGSA
ncbi:MULTISPECIES: hypothetical protein [Falsihalocynthiibacter]|uniref:hypothetical protein n=1 Tax=Falsihalocynthiibacter TaxID=2854182 RepID=UPI0030038FE9